MAMAEDAWPELAVPGWEQTAATVHRWAQIVGKTRLALAAAENHWWHVPLYVSARGLDTSIIHDGDRAFSVELDLVDHALRVRGSRGEAGFALEPMSVAAFFDRYRSALRAIGVEHRVLARPVEVEDATPFAEDEAHRSYDRGWIERLHVALRHADALLKAFRGGFVGKASPVHFFWGAFDLATTRFSGRPAPRHPGGIPNVADRVMREAYSHEVSSAGFWPGDARFPEAAFYAYAYPEPPGFAAARVPAAGARYEPALGEFVLPYAAVRRARDPAAEVRAFLESTYAAAADLAAWDRRALERQEPS